MRIAKSDYTYNIIDDVICIEDLNQGRMSVTNDAENVLSEIYLSKIGEAIKKYPIIYKDSEGIWDRMIPKWDNGSCVDVEFLHLGETNIESAIKKVKS